MSKPKVYDEGRKCTICNKTLSIYNKGPDCKFHTVGSKKNPKIYRGLATVCTSPVVPKGCP